ncbi:MAG: hypothetical protein LBR19_09200 [Bifidobacteriaceae bacterium]|jgi:hypothetical protein|nr:hypothetical protein [Bifidobacteriaceae bacterium]
MSSAPDGLSVFLPGVVHWNDEKERRNNDIHEYVVDAPPFDTFLDAGVIDLSPSPQPAAVLPAPPAVERGPARRGEQV